LYYIVEDTASSTHYADTSAYLPIQVMGPRIVITAPADSDKVTFDSSATGILSITATGTVNPLPAYQDSLLWSITPIAGCSLLVSPPSAIGRTVDFTFRHLPSDNDEFGDKYIKASIPKWNLAESVLVNTFYTKCAYNSPIDTVPNWFYYWQEGSVIPEFSSDIRHPQVDSLPRALGYTNLDKIYLTIRADSAEYPQTGITVGNYTFYEVRGLDCTASVIGHEKFHQWLYNQWHSGAWGIWDTTTDCDGDWLPNWFERDSSQTDSLNQDSKGIYTIFGWQDEGIGDNEYWACVRGLYHPRGDSLKDWSYGRYSKQWPGP
jgi:hypothetical protein